MPFPQGSFSLFAGESSLSWHVLHVPVAGAESSIPRPTCGPSKVGWGCLPLPQALHGGSHKAVTWPPLPTDSPGSIWERFALSEDTRLSPSL